HATLEYKKPTNAPAGLPLATNPPGRPLTHGLDSHPGRGNDKLDLFAPRASDHDNPGPGILLLLSTRMARKKNRPSHFASGTETPVVAGPPPVPPPAPRDPAVETADFRKTPTGRFFLRLFRVFSSLQLAVVLLSIFTSSLIVATLLESWY